LPEHTKHRRPAGRATVALADRILRSALADARRLGRLATDPMMRVDKRSGPPPRREHWDAATIGRFLTARTTVEDRCSAAWELALLKGFRRGDLAGLKWQEPPDGNHVHLSGVDVDQWVIHLDLQRTMAGGKVVEKPLKQRDADDPPTIVELGPRLWAAMRAHRTRMLKEADEQGRPLSPYVFCRPDGEAYQPQWFLRRFQRLSQLAGVPVMPLHGGRHTTATLASSLNINDSTTQQVMRHADRSTTADYQHDVPGIQRVVEEEFVRAIFGSGGPAAA
jgi:integrase